DLSKINNKIGLANKDNQFLFLNFPFSLHHSLMVTYELAASTSDLAGILALQKQNLPTNISEQEAQSQGFVTVHHNLEILERMNAQAPSIIAKDGGQIIGYNIAMTRDFAKDIPVLIPMFEIMDELEMGGQKMKDMDYIVCGQVCVDKAYRGQGIFAGMYQFYQQQYAPRFAVIITEIARRNTRSIRAHEKVGFEIVHSYQLTGGEVWEIVRWDWRK
ncbi:MAG: N-acetyltransferase family protein, partial [Saprospiraceae bacterium]